MGAVGKRMASVWGLGCLLLYSVISLNFSPIQGVAVRPVYDHYHDREVCQPHHYSYDRGHSHSAVRHVTVVKKRRPRPRVVHRTIIVEEEPLPHVGSVHVVRQPAVHQPPVHVVQQTDVRPSCTCCTTASCPSASCICCTTRSTTTDCARVSTSSFGPCGICSIRPEGHTRPLHRKNRPKANPCSTCLDTSTG